MPHIIRTSDRKTFKQCRQLWDFTSKIRQNWEPDNEKQVFSFGTAIHAGLETYYEPKTWSLPKETVEPLAIAEFVKSYAKREGLSDQGEIDYQETLELGKGMLEGYFTWAAQKDAEFGLEPVYVEIEFEVPIPIWDYPPLPLGFRPTVDGKLEFNGESVVYQGRLDMLAKDRNGNYWIVDHKTAGSFGSTEHLSRDEQCGSYMWAIQEMLGIKVEGVIYNELLKTVPQPPKLLQKGGLSKDKRQSTTVELYEQEIHRLGYNPGEYAEVLEFLRAQGNKFFRRSIVRRNQAELENLGNAIALEAIDMLNTPSIYTNATRMNCSGCDFAGPCQAKLESSDHEWMLNESFHIRT